MSASQRVLRLCLHPLTGGWEGMDEDSAFGLKVVQDGSGTGATLTVSPYYASAASAEDEEVADAAIARALRIGDVGECPDTLILEEETANRDSALYQDVSAADIPDLLPISRLFDLVAKSVNELYYWRPCSIASGADVPVKDELITLHFQQLVRLRNSATSQANSDMLTTLQRLASDIDRHLGGVDAGGRTVTQTSIAAKFVAFIRAQAKAEASACATHVFSAKTEASQLAAQAPGSGNVWGTITPYHLGGEWFLTPWEDDFGNQESDRRELEEAYTAYKDEWSALVPGVEPPRTLRAYEATLQQVRNVLESTAPIRIADWFVRG